MNPLLGIFCLVVLSLNASLVNSCDDFPCQNGATCTVTGNTTYVCHCPDGYYGDHCENVDPCASNPCDPHGNCELVPEDGSYICHCDSDWEGEHCEIRHCAPDARTSDPTKCCNFPFVYLAKSYDSCTTRNNDGVLWCAFDLMFIVNRWANCVNPCSDFPCQNGGACNIIDDDTHTCDCPEGFEGDNCENVGWTAEGCYKEAKNSANKIFPLLYYTVKNIDPANPDLELIYNECKDRAESAGYGIFGIKSTNKCITTADGALIDDYDRLGQSTECLTDEDGHGVGTASKGRSFYCYTRS